MPTKFADFYWPFTLVIHKSASTNMKDTPVNIISIPAFFSG
jgi:hypothetical protein